MERVVSHLLKQFEDGKVTRRQLIQGLSAVALAASGGSAEAQPAQAGFRTLNFDHASYDVTDYRRTRDFYAGLLGMTVTNDNGKDACELHFGDPRGVGVRDRQLTSVQNRPGARRDHLPSKNGDWETDPVRAGLERRRRN